MEIFPNAGIIKDDSQIRTSISSKSEKLEAYITNIKHIPIQTSAPDIPGNVYNSVEEDILVPTAFVLIS